MWLMDTDIALTTFDGKDGLNVFARSLQSAQPLAGLEVTLLSKGNEPLGKVVTGADGRADFPRGLMRGKGIAQATAVMAVDPGKQEFARLELTKSAFDLSDRGVDGRDQPGPVDGFLYTERGVYRPGETVQVMAMLRDSAANALANMPVTLIVNRPDGTEFTRYVAALPASGALYQAIPLPKSSRRGRWSVAAHIDPKAAAVGKVDFSVEDFVPEKLKVELTSDAPLLRTGKRHVFGVQADFLYGAPASGLAVESDLRVTVDNAPFKDFAKYTFGLEKQREKFEPPLITLNAPETDPAGKSRLEWAGDQVKDTSLPLQVQVQARVFEPGNGRSTKTDKVLPLRTRDAYIGIRPVFDGNYAPEGQDSEFELVAVDADGKQIALPGRRLQDREDRLQLSVVPERRPLALADDRLRPADHRRHGGTEGRCAGPSVAPPRLGPVQAHRQRQAERYGEQPHLLCRLVRRRRHRSGARHPEGRERQEELRARRDGQAAPRPAVRGRGADRHRHRPHRRHLHHDRAGGRHHRRHPDQGRMGRRRLCAGDRLAAALEPGRACADTRHRHDLARPRSRAPHPAGADRGAGEDHAAPEDRRADPCRWRLGRGLRHPGRRRRRHPAAHALPDAEARRILLRQAQARPLHARRLRPPARCACRRSGASAHRRRFGRHRRPRRGADPHRGAVQRPGEARRQGRGEDRARRPRLHRPAPPDGGGLRQDQGRLGRRPSLRARCRDRRRRAAALPRPAGSRPRGAVVAERRWRSRRLSGEARGNRRRCPRTAGRRDTQARRQPARPARPGHCARAMRASARSPSPSRDRTTSRSDASGTSRCGRPRRRAPSTR